MIKLSVIIASHCSDSRHGYSRLFLSLIGYSNQSLLNEYFEVIIIDDGSDWELENLIDLWEFDFQYSVLRQVHTGRCSSFQKGIETAKGKYVLLANDTDIPEKDCLAKHLEKLESSNEKSVICGRTYQVKHIRTIIDPLSGTSYTTPQSLAEMLQHMSSIFEEGIISEKDILENFDTLLMRSGISGKNKRIERLLEDKKLFSSFVMPWVVMQIGNHCLSKEQLIEVGGFDPFFDPEGIYMEPELGLRLFENGADFLLEKEAIMLHISDWKIKTEFQDDQEKHAYFCQKFPKLEVALLPFFYSLEEKCSLEELSYWIKRAKKVMNLEEKVFSK